MTDDNSAEADGISTIICAQTVKKGCCTDRKKKSPLSWIYPAIVQSETKQAGVG